MNEGPIWDRFMKQTRGQKSRATVPLTSNTTLTELLSHVNTELKIYLGGFGRIKWQWMYPKQVYHLSHPWEKY
jgi:hypothetical protein